MTQPIQANREASAAKPKRLDETVVVHKTPLERLERGMSLCQQGRWQEGVNVLSEIAASQRKAGELPGRYYSYLGYGLALTKRQYDEGIQLCRYAIKQEFYQPENYVNLARSCMLAGKRRMAWKAVARGLSVDANHPGLVELQAEMGARRPPVLPFLSRSSFLNVLLGRVRYSMSKPIGKGDGKAGSNGASAEAAKKDG